MVTAYCSIPDANDDAGTTALTSLPDIETGAVNAKAELPAQPFIPDPNFKYPANKQETAQANNIQRLIERSRQHK